MALRQHCAACPHLHASLPPACMSQHTPPSRPPLRLALPVQLIAVLNAMTWNQHVCGGRALADPAAQRLTGSTYSFLAMAHFTLLPAPASTLHPEQECAVVLAFLQLAVAVVLPALAQVGGTGAGAAWHGARCGMGRPWYAGHRWPASSPAPPPASALVSMVCVSVTPSHPTPPPQAAVESALFSDHQQQRQQAGLPPEGKLQARLYRWLNEMTVALDGPAAFVAVWVMLGMLWELAVLFMAGRPQAV